MANITPYKNKDGKIVSYRIKVFRGRDCEGKQLKPYMMTWKIPDGLTKKQIEKELNKQAVLFEEQCQRGTAAVSSQTFAQYAEYAMAQKERGGLKHSTLVGYRTLLKRINQGIGHLKLTEIRPQHLNAFYQQLEQEDVKYYRSVHIKDNVDLQGMIKNKYGLFSSFSAKTGIADTVRRSASKDNISLVTAEKIAAALDCEVKTLFDAVDRDTKLSNKTVIEHHRLISSILHQAEKEMLIPLNPAQRATLPKLHKKEVNYFEPDELEKILKAADCEPIMWRTITYVLAFSGIRRGELCGLKWSAIDFENNILHIENNLLYTADRGIYEDTPKTKTSVRDISMPQKVMELLKKLKVHQTEITLSFGDYRQRTDFVFTRDNGLPIHPDSVSSWFTDFSARHKLPHINPHAFRHTMASTLLYAGMDIVSTSKRLGHAKVSTTSDVYAHAIKRADEKASATLEDLFLKKA